MWSIALLTNLWQRRFHSEHKLNGRDCSVPPVIFKASDVSYTQVTISANLCCMMNKTVERRRLLGRQKDARICDMQDNVKQGDHLRTLGGAMTALKYCICCSARDYPKIWVSYHSSGNVFSWSPQRGLSGSYLIRRLEYFSVYKLIRVVSL